MTKPQPTSKGGWRVSLCVDCYRPAPKKFMCGKYGPLCAACAVDFYMQQPGAIVTFREEPILGNCES